MACPDFDMTYNFPVSALCKCALAYLNCFYLFYRKPGYISNNNAPSGPGMQAPSQHTIRWQVFFMTHNSHFIHQFLPGCKYKLTQNPVHKMDYLELVFHLLLKPQQYQLLQTHQTTVSPCTRQFFLGVQENTGFRTNCHLLKPVKIHPVPSDIEGVSKANFSNNIKHFAKSSL